MGFLPFTPKASPIVFGLLWTFLQDYLPIHWLLGHYLCLEYVCYTTTHFMTKFSFVCSYYIPLPLGSNGWGLGYLTTYLYGMHQMVPAIYYLFWVRYHPSRVYSQKKSRLETKYRPIFPPPPNHILWIPLTMGPPPLYWLGTGWWCSGPYVLAPLSFVFVFFRSHAISVIVDLFCFVLQHVSVLFLHVFPTMFVISFGLAFLSFTQFLLLTLLAIPCFFLLYYFILVFTPILLYKRIWAFVGQIMLTISKRS